LAQVCPLRDARPFPPLLQLAMARSPQRLAIVSVVAFGATQLGCVSAQAGTEAGECEFVNLPVDVGYFWDPTCKMGKLGCNADGKNLQCRLCGAGDFVTVPCPASSCKFPNDPFVSYYWDTDCKMGKLGCWADGIHAQCRFCGEYPYTSISCPEGAAPPNAAACTFKNKPEIPHYWEAGCVMGKHGCNADGQNVQCRFCGGGDFSDIPCPAEQVCEFKQKPTVPYYWDPQCKDGMLGCKADGVNDQCRFCATRPFEDVPCPESVAPPKNVCTWPLRGEPLTPYFWDPTCTMGKLGCWADGLHAQCRFCGTGVFEEVACPSTTTTPAVTQPAVLQQAQDTAVQGARLAHETVKSAVNAATGAAQRKSQAAHDWYETDPNLEVPLSGTVRSHVVAATLLFVVVGLASYV